MKNDPLFEDFEYIVYTLTLSTKLKERLDLHLERLKYIQHPERIRQSWLLHALNEKLHREESVDSFKNKYLNLELKQEVVEQLNARLALAPKILTKKKWILDAIQEKIEAEKSLMQKKQTPENQKKLEKVTG